MEANTLLTASLFLQARNNVKSQTSNLKWIPSSGRREVALGLLLLLAATMFAALSCTKDKSSRGASISTYTGTMQLAYKTSGTTPNNAACANPACFVNLATGEALKVKDVLSGGVVQESIISQIDLVWGDRGNYTTQWYMVSPSDNDGILSMAVPDAAYWHSGNLFAGWTKRNQTVFSNKNLTGKMADFDAITTRAQLDQFATDNGINGQYDATWNTFTFQGNASDLNNIRYFQASHGGTVYCGLIVFTKADMSLTGTGQVDYTIKVYKQ
jgi:hypothetical protein